MTDNKYNSLLKVLDTIIDSAPENLKKKRYSTLNEAERNHARSLAFIHLYMMARHGVIDFNDREQLITDDVSDGGIDGYYIDSSLKTVYLIQAKFRTTESNFTSKFIDTNELLAMDVNRIIQGEVTSLNGEAYNGRILGLQRKLRETKNIGQYDYKIVILANVKHDEQALFKLTGGFSCEVFNFEKTYEKLLFPVISGSYFDPDELEVSINLSNAEHPRIKYKVDLGEMKSDITVLFVPTKEIAKILHKYKNSILKYNPRSYLEMRRNSVNDEIRKTIVESENNEFALFNNGITMIASESWFSERTGSKAIASLSLKNPQIINGGQTAFTLSRIYEDSIKLGETAEDIFNGKEVLVKIISFSRPDENISDEDYSFAYSDDVLRLIERVSTATNSQNPIDAADKKSNEYHHVEFQRHVFKKTGLFYERKRGEFSDGLSNEYIGRDALIKRDDLMRCCLAASGKAGEARRANKKYLFSDQVATTYLGLIDNYDKYIDSYLCFKELKKIEREEKITGDKYLQVKYGSALRYGKYAVVSAYSYIINEVIERPFQLSDLLDIWKLFETYVLEKHKAKYFKADSNMLNYYKGFDVNLDIKDFFGDKTIFY